MALPHPRRKPMRLAGFDYRTPGAYFVTICIQHRACLLGEIHAHQIHLNAAGRMVEEIWLSLPGKFPGVRLDAFIIMPNHIHLLLWIAWLPTTPPAPPAASLPEMMRWFKSLTTARYRQGVHADGWPAYPGKLWQRSYFDHIVRSEAALDAIRGYIVTNPERWALDVYNAQRCGQDPLAHEIWRLLQAA